MGGGSSREVITNHMNEITAEVITSITMDCAQQTASAQSIDITCEPVLTDPSIPYENSTACRTCLGNVRDQALLRYRLIENTFGSRSADIPLTVTDDFTTIITQMTECMKTCKACYLQGISQNTIVDLQTECESLNTISNKISQELLTKVRQELEVRKDAISGFAGILGTRDTQSTVTNITNRMRAKITNDVLTQVRNNVNSTQNLSFNLGSGAVSGINQYNTFQNVVSYLEENQIFNNVFTTAEIDQFNSLYDDSNTIGALGSIASKSAQAFAKLTKSVTGWLIIAIAATVAAVVSILFITRFVRVVMLKAKTDGKSKSGETTSTPGVAGATSNAVPQTLFT